MGRIKHDAVIVTGWDAYPDELAKLREFAADLPDSFRRYIVESPVVVNGYVTFMFAPDGSKEGWGHSEDAASYRQSFAELGKELEMDVVCVSYGGDDDYVEVRSSVYCGWRSCLAGEHLPEPAVKE